MTLECAEKLFRRKREELTAELCKKCVDHVKDVEISYWKTERIVDEKMEKFEFSLDDRDDSMDECEDK